MDFDQVFSIENVEMLFKTDMQKGTFIAEASDCYSDYMTKEDFSRQWAHNLPAGRYVITIYRRCSVYEEGEQIWKNQEDLSEVGADSRFSSPRYVIALEEMMKYKVPSWVRPLSSHIIRNDDNPLEPELYVSLEKAEKQAAKRACRGIRSAVLEWFADYDMY